MDGSKSTVEKSRGLKKLFASISSFHSSLSATCGISSARNVSDSVVPPIFVPSRHQLHEDHQYCGKLKPHNTHILPPLVVPPPDQPTSVSVDCRSCRPSKPARRRSFPAPDQSDERNVNTETRKKKWKLLSNGYGFTSCSSGDSDDESFSSEDEDDESRKPVKGETETLFSSKSFSSDSSEFYKTSSKNKNEKNQRNRNKKDTVMRCDQRRRRPSRKVVVGNNEGTAVVKQTRDPYGDFRSSVVEMVVENQIVGGKDLEHLLRSYLALNSLSHHPIILQVFDDVWATLLNG